MSTNGSHMEEMRDRIDRLKARRRRTAADGRIDEGSDRCAAGQGIRAAAVRDNSAGPELKVRCSRRGSRPPSAGYFGHAKNPKEFIESMDAYVEDYWELNHP